MDYDAWAKFACVGGVCMRRRGAAVSFQYNFHSLIQLFVLRACYAHFYVVHTCGLQSRSTSSVLQPRLFHTIVLYSSKHQAPGWVSETVEAPLVFRSDWIPFSAYNIEKATYFRRMWETRRLCMIFPWLWSGPRQLQSIHPLPILKRRRNAEKGNYAFPFTSHGNGPIRFSNLRKFVSPFPVSFRLGLFWRFENVRECDA